MNGGQTSGSESTSKMAFSISVMPLLPILEGGGGGYIAFSLASILPKSFSGSRDLGNKSRSNRISFTHNTTHPSNTSKIFARKLAKSSSKDKP